MGSPYTPGPQFPLGFETHKFSDLITQLVGISVKLQLEGKLPEEMKATCAKIKKEINKRMNEDK